MTAHEPSSTLALDEKGRLKPYSQRHQRELREKREREPELREERERQRVAREIERLQGELGALVNELKSLFPQ